MKWYVIFFLTHLLNIYVHVHVYGVLDKEDTYLLIYLPSNIQVEYIAKRKTVGKSDDGAAAGRPVNKSEFNFEG